MACISRVGLPGHSHANDDQLALVAMQKNLGDMKVELKKNAHGND